MFNRLTGEAVTCPPLNTEPERAACTQFTDDVNRTVVAINNGLGDGQAEPGAFMRGRRFHLMEALEDLFLKLQGDTGTLVGDAQLHRMLLFDSSYCNSCRAGREFDR